MSLGAAQRLRERKRDLVKRYARASDLAGATQIATTLVPYVALWALALWSTNVSYGLTGLAIAALVLFNIRAFSLLHDCGHGSLFRSMWLNRSVGFGLGVLSGMPQYVWSQHHDYHHRTNGDWEKYRGPLAILSVAQYEALSESGKKWYRRSRHMGIAPIAGFVYLIFNPRFTWMKGTIQLLAHLVRRKIESPSISLREHAASFRTRYWATRRQYWHMFANNVVLLCGVWAVMCWLVGPARFFLIYLPSVSLAGGVGMVMFTVQHNFENSYASASADWNYEVGTLEGTSFLVFPAWMNWFTADIGYHHVHHLSSAIPNYRLAECHRENQDLFTSVTRLRFSQIPQSLRCILWDERSRKIITVATAETQARLAARLNLDAA